MRHLRRAQLIIDMNITDIIQNSGKPELYEDGTKFMWADEHISEQLLQIHLNPDIDLGSRKHSTIQKTIDWIMAEVPYDRSLKILDLGCGIGLYAEIFTELGHKVTGIDISKKSIEYAKDSASKKGLEIDYRCADYLSMDSIGEYDLVTMIYTDFGVLKPKDRDSLLEMVLSSLKPDGKFIFDVLTDNNLISKSVPKNWEVSEIGFWKDSPHLVLSDSIIYEKESVILYQHTVIDEHDNVDSYRFWTHFFNRDKIKELINSVGVKKMSFRDDIIPEGDNWSGDNVLFTIVTK